jgi:long-subunit acyl-CoA synthetase (AMP-forming)
MLVLSTEPWTIENGCLTPTMKIKRSRIEFNVQHQIDNWYTHGKNVIWA